jgi:two-component system phosphate regulon response regulator OmpR
VSQARWADAAAPTDPRCAVALTSGAKAMNQQQTHIVVVDDEEDIRSTLEEYLGLQGFRVSCAANGAELRRLVDEENFDLAVLDITMPGEDGLSLARFLREHTDVGIVMLTASSDVIDRIVGLEMGADDYLAKPVDLRELLARLKAVLRRTKSQGSAVYGEDGTLKETAFGDCRLNLDSHKLYDADGGEIPITSMEYDLLKAFAEHPNRVLNRDQLLDLAHNRDWEPFDRSIDIRIARIRRKIERDPAKPQIIKTVRGTGYVYAPDKGN